MLRCIIIDDETPMRKSLESMLKTSCPNIKLIAEADGVGNGVEVIKKYQPDLVFLDIKMGDGTGFDLLKQFDPVDFKVIFITAFDQYAVKAFRFSALDYLLKPVDVDDLVEAVNRTESLFVNELNTQLDALRENLRTGDGSGKKIILRTLDSIHLISTHDIFYCESDGSYTTFYLLNGNKIQVSTRLKEYDDLLSEFGFFRVHKSYLINLTHISRFDKSEGGYIVLTNDSKVPVSSRKRDRILELFNMMGGEGA